MLLRRRVRRETVLAPGHTIRGEAPYVVEHPIGVGAFALVYRGADAAGRPVAIKEYRLPLSRRERAVVARMWRREVETLRSIPPHPALPRFAEGFALEGRDYVIQEYIEGESLADILERRGALEEHEAVKWGRQICEALAYLHNQGVVHHDLKPENVIIGPQGRVALLDLGSAQFLGRDVGDLYGSEGYLAPEVRKMASRRGVEVQPGTDVFALGCLLYEVLVGRRPSQRHIDGCSVRLVGPLLQRLNQFDAGLVNVIIHAISYDADYRYGDAHEMLAELLAAAPAVAEADRAEVDFGTLRGRERRKATVRITNAGGGALEAQATARAPWLRVGLSTLREDEAVAVEGNHVTLTITALAQNMPVRAQPQRGVVEIVCPLTTVTVACVARIEPEAAMIQTYYPALFLRARRGQPARGSIGVRNIGAQTGQVTCLAEDGAPLRFEPDTFILNPMETQDVAVTVDTRSLPVGGHTLPVRIATGSGHRADVEVHVDVFAGPVRRLLER